MTPGAGGSEEWTAISAIKMVNVKSCVFADGPNFLAKVGHDCVKLSLVVWPSTILIRFHN